jgi:hypothetical protein
LARGTQKELDRHVLGAVLFVAVFDRVDDGFAHGDAHPVHRIVTQPGERRHAVADDLNQVEKLERTGQLDAHHVPVSQHAAD